MNRVGMGAACLLFLLAAGSIPAQSSGDAWADYRGIVGEWVAEGDGSGGTGQFSLAFDLNEKILVRRNHADVPAQGQRPASKHDDLMILYHAPGGKAVRAIYFDNEEHVIEYTATWSDDKKTLTLVSAANAPGPRFRLTYKKLEDDKLNVQFEIASPGKPNDFQKYVDGTCRRKK